MKWFFRRRRKPELYPIGGPEPGLDYWGTVERERRIQEIAEHNSTSIKEATLLADSWYIRTVERIVGGNSSLQYIPLPVWDLEWAWRKSFDTREEAVEYIHSINMRLLVPEHGNSDLQPDA